MAEPIPQDIWSARILVQMMITDSKVVPAHLMELAMLPALGDLEPWTPRFPAPSWSDGDWWGLGVILGVISAAAVIGLIVWLVR